MSHRLSQASVLAMYLDMHLYVSLDTQFVRSTADSGGDMGMYSVEISIGPKPGHGLLTWTPMVRGSLTVCQHLQDEADKLADSSQSGEGLVFKVLLCNQ